MPLFTVTGDDRDDWWCVDGSPNFTILPASIIQTLSINAPVWLKVGTPDYGVNHILARHSNWVNEHKMSVPELVYLKLGQSGDIYCTERNSKLKLSLAIHPQALVVLDLIKNCDTTHFSVTTIYGHNRGLDGDRIGRYPGRDRAQQMILNPPPPKTKNTGKKGHKKKKRKPALL